MTQSAQELMMAYHLLAHLKLDDHTYTHLSCRTLAQKSFYLARFGLRFEEVGIEDMLEVGIKERAVICGQDSAINITAYGLHADTYAARPSCQAIFHIHTPEMVAVSAHPEGLMPLSQWALHFYEKVAYYSYDSLLLEQQQSVAMLQALGQAPVMLMRHHGALILGRTIAEAVFFTYHLQQACRAQCLILSSCANPLRVPAKLAEKSRNDLLSFEKNLGQRDWLAWQRLLLKEKTKKP